ncbi:MAG: DnaA/Hda family protein [Patescibacteria group bacterium]|nr:DnaA/Hda family protein [Patescibacteria group bacterium]
MAGEIARIPLSGKTDYTDSGTKEAVLRFALDCYYVGSENPLVEVAVRSVLNDRAGRFNPLLFCGPPGTGKSHLACGMADQWRRVYRGRVVCVSAKTFARDLADAFEVNAVVEFRARYRECSLLALEDIERLSGRSAAQVEMIHTMDALLSAGTQIVLTASELPTRLDQLHPTLASRLIAGLVVRLAPPGPAVRATLLRHMAAARSIELSEPVAHILAEGVPGTVPDLMVVFDELEQAARLAGGIHADAVRAYLRARNAAREPQLSAIAVRTARYFSLRLGDLRGPSRRRAVVTARDVAMYLARSLTRNSLEQIGHYFGGRDHTTVLHGCRKTGDLLKTDPAVQQAIERVGSKWRGVGPGAQRTTATGSAFKREFA